MLRPALVELARRLANGLARDRLGITQDFTRTGIPLPILIHALTDQSLDFTRTHIRSAQCFPDRHLVGFRAGVIEQEIPI